MSFLSPSDPLNQPKEKGKFLEAILFPLLLAMLMWIIFLADRSFHLDLYKWGVKPHTLEGLKGIVFMPLIHGQKDFSHIINNTLPTLILLGTLIYFYRKIASIIFFSIWIGSGILLWNIAINTGSYHIGMSGVLYGLFGFLLHSGFLIKSLPLQAISLFVAFVYGYFVWGIFPMEEGISWEGHLSGLLVGILLAIVFRKKGPQPQKYPYEIEEEMGIEPPDFEAEWNRRKQAMEEWQQKIKEQQKQQQDNSNKEDNKSGNASSSHFIGIEYHYKANNNKEKKK